LLQTPEPNLHFAILIASCARSEHTGLRGLDCPADGDRSAEPPTVPRPRPTARTWTRLVRPAVLFRANEMLTVPLSLSPSLRVSLSLSLRESLPLPPSLSLSLPPSLPPSLSLPSSCSRSSPRLRSERVSPAWDSMACTASLKTHGRHGFNGRRRSLQVLRRSVKAILNTHG
jgi:hypothetical protein